MIYLLIHCLLAFNYRQLVWFTLFQFLCFTLLFDQDCVDSMSIQKLLLVIIYLLEDEQELTLGMLIRPKRIDTSQTYQ